MKKPILLILALGFVSLITKANNYYVTTTSDTGAGSLRVMIDSANAHTGLDTITLNLTVHDTIHLGDTLPGIFDSLIITGLPCQNPTITGDSAIFYTSPFCVPNATVPLALNYLNIINCSANVSGAVLVSRGKLYINNCYFYGNSSVGGGSGGGAAEAPAAWVYNSTFSNNSALAGGAGGALYVGNCCIYNCTFIGNYAAIKGGAIDIGDNNFGDTIQNCTFNGNVAVYGGSALRLLPVDTGFTFANNIVWGNIQQDTSFGPDGAIELLGKAISGGCNILQDSVAADSFKLASSDIVGVNPQFGTFGYYSGCVPVLPILCGSVAQNHATCTGATTTDAEGIAAQGARDAGAFEITSPHLYSDSLDSIQPGTTADLYNYFNTTGLTIQWPNGLNDSSATSVDTGTYTVIGTNFLGCSDTATVTLIYATDTVSGIKNVRADNSVKLYPNPARSQVIITWSDKTSGLIVLKITDILGQTVFAQNMDGATGKYTMNTSALSPGSYFVRLITNAETAIGARLIVLEK